MKRLVWTGGMACALSLLTFAAEAESTTPPFTHFVDWCENQAHLTPEARHTVEALLIVAETQNCDRADTILKKLTELQLGGLDIVNLEPLASLTHLTDLTLSFNQIEDIKPLAALTRLQWLNLAQNQIADVTPLSNLVQLTGLSLHGNQIADIQPLSTLTNLETLHLQYNQIERIEALASLTQLTWLNLAQNPLRDRTCPIQPGSICSF